MGTRIGGVEVVRGTSIRWAALFTVMVGGPVYALFQGWIRGIQGFWGWITGMVVGLGEFLASLVGGLLSGGAGAISVSWWSFLAELTSSGAGPFTYVITVASVMFVAWVLSVGVNRWLS